MAAKKSNQAAATKKKAKAQRSAASGKKAASKKKAAAAAKKKVAQKKAAAKKKAASKKKAAARVEAPGEDEAPEQGEPESATPARQRPAKGRVVNRSELAEFYGVSLPTVTSWVRRGCPYVAAGHRGREWQFNTAAVAAWREELAYSNAVGDSSSWSIEEARKRREAAEAALKEIELAKARGEIVEIEAVADIVGDDYSRVRARLLAVPPKCAPLCHRAESVTEVREILDDGVREALNELSSSVAGEFAEEDSPDEGEAAETAASSARQ